MKTIEVSAKTREAAIEKALQELGVERHQIEVEIVDEGSAGILGIGRRDVRIKVKADVAEEAEEQTRERQPRGGDRERGGRSRGGRGRGEKGGKGKGGRRDSGERKEAGEPKDRGERKERGKRDRGGNGRSKGRSDRKDEAPKKAKESAPKREPRRREEPKADKPPKELNPAELERRGHEAAALLKELIEKMGMESEVTSHVLDEGGIRLDVQAEDSAILIGRKGQTLRSMQYLLNRMMDEGDLEPEERLIIDVEGYIDRRQEKLEEMALGMAEKAKDSRRRMRLKPLSSQERRIVHLALKEDTDVRTFSVGSGEMRSVVIAPKDEEEDEDRGGRGRRGRGRGGRGRGRDRDDDTESRESAQDDDRASDEDEDWRSGRDDSGAPDDTDSYDDEDTGVEEEHPSTAVSDNEAPAERRESEPQAEAVDDGTDEADEDDDDDDGDEPRSRRARARRRRKKGGFRGRAAVTDEDNSSGSADD